MYRVHRASVLWDFCYGLGHSRYIGLRPSLAQAIAPFFPGRAF